jgi:hypothetical protein
MRVGQILLQRLQATRLQLIDSYNIAAREILACAGGQKSAVS